MKKISLFLTVSLAFVFFTGCSNKYPPLPTVKKVNINKYIGKWYEIARFEHFFEKNCKNVTATYKLRDDNKIDVTNSCVDINTNEKKTANGIAYAKDETNSKLRVSFFRPFYGDYWIIQLDSKYKYAVVGTPSRKYLWILSREKTISNSLKNAILKKIVSLGFDKNKIIWTIQD